MDDHDLHWNTRSDSCLLSDILLSIVRLSVSIADASAYFDSDYKPSNFLKMAVCLCVSCFASLCRQNILRMSHASPTTNFSFCARAGKRKACWQQSVRNSYNNCHYCRLNRDRSIGVLSPLAQASADHVYSLTSNGDAHCQPEIIL